MSTAIIQQTSLYEFGDLFLKNQAVMEQLSEQGGPAAHAGLARARSLGAAAAPAPVLRQALALLQHRRLERAASEPAQQQPPNASRYKTELCRPFEEAGCCKYGDKCQFAHGYRELRNLQRHPKYKTELCRTFHSVGFCPYGPRCHFVHNADEARSGPSQPASPPSPGSSLSRSPADSVASFFPASAPESPRTSPPPSPEESRLPVFNRLAVGFEHLALA